MINPIYFEEENKLNNVQVILKRKAHEMFKMGFKQCFKNYYNSS